MVSKGCVERMNTTALNVIVCKSLHCSWSSFMIFQLKLFVKSTFLLKLKRYDGTQFHEKFYKCGKISFFPHVWSCSNGLLPSKTSSSIELCPKLLKYAKNRRKFSIMILIFHQVRWAQIGPHLQILIFYYFELE